MEQSLQHPRRVTVRLTNAHVVEGHVTVVHATISKLGAYVACTVGTCMCVGGGWGLVVVVAVCVCVGGGGGGEHMTMKNIISRITVCL
jgi:hypothetical protein